MSQSQGKPNPYLVDGRALADSLYRGVRAEVKALSRLAGRAPGLAVVLVQNREDSLLYTQLKHRKAAELGILSENYCFPPDVSLSEILALLEQLNGKPEIDGILVQLPLPAGLAKHTNTIIEAVRPTKDVDGLTIANQGYLAKHSRQLMMCDPVCRPGFSLPFATSAPRQDPVPEYHLACTPLACMHILEHLESRQELGFRIEGSHVVMVGRSALVGQPLALMLTGKNATVTLCHSLTDDLRRHCLCADVVIVATGVPGLITGDMIKPGAVVVDVGTSVAEPDMERDNTSRKRTVVGDVSFEDVASRCAAITPVPGGVGPLTVAMLFVNTVRAARFHCRSDPKADTPTKEEKQRTPQLKLSKI